MVLRLLVLKHIRNWSYEVLEREVRANLVYRDFTHVGGGKTPDRSRAFASSIMNCCVRNAPHQRREGSGMIEMRPSATRGSASAQRPPHRSACVRSRRAAMGGRVRNFCRFRVV